MSYDDNYYEIIPDDDMKDLSFTPKCDIEKIIRIIPIDEEDRFKKSNWKLGVITINLSNVLGKSGKPLYEGVFKYKEI